MILEIFKHNASSKIFDFGVGKLGFYQQEEPEESIDEDMNTTDGERGGWH